MCFVKYKPSNSGNFYGWGHYIIKKTISASFPWKNLLNFRCI